MNIELSKHTGKSLSLFALVMINVIAVDNLRSLAISAQYGFSLVFFYLLAAVLFFIPTILVTAELATGWPNTGGVYVWVREAFGPRWGFLTIWLQWIYNVVWYPTIFAFIAGMLAYVIDPQLVNNKTYMLSVILIAFWSMTIVNCFGIKLSSVVCIISAIIGTLVPMVFIAILGFIWIQLGKPIQINFTLKDFFPNQIHINNLAFFTNVLFGLMGMEMSAVHAEDVHHPQQNYPRALLISSFIIMITLICACLAIAIVVPSAHLSLVSGLIDAFSIFFNSYQMNWCIPVIALLITIGSLGCATAWIMGPARGLLIASHDNQFPRFFKHCNKRNAPVGILLIQGVIVTALCAIFLIMPTVNSSYWVLSNLTAQLALVFYILLFAAAIRLRYKHAHVKRYFHVPGGKWGIWVVSCIGIATCSGAIILGFIPPSKIAVGDFIVYETILVGGILLFCAPPFLMQFFTKLARHRK